MELMDFGLKEDFINLTSKAKELHAKINEWDYIKSFCTAQETNHKTKRQPAKWKKIFANNISDKRLISKIYEEFLTVKRLKEAFYQRRYPNDHEM